MAVLAHVDAFTNVPFHGNPAAVCLLLEDGDDAWMQAVAAETNLPMTAFLVPSRGAYELRWFTPRMEEELCGHATLAAAHLLWETGSEDPGDVVRFDTRSGRVTASRDADGWTWLDFPNEAAEPCSPPEGLPEALGAKPVRVAGNRLDLFAELEDARAVADLAPDLPALARFDGYRGVVVTAPGDGDTDYVCRFFSPQCGIDEDPVTGSIQCALGPWWAVRLGRSTLVGEQLSARGGRFRVRPEGDRVHIGGQAVTFAVSELLV